MKSIDNVYEDLIVINKSKFFSFAYPVFSESEAKEYLDKLNRKYSDATHICYAYSISSPRLEKADDNGEPSGTAGKPLLELIKKKGLENVLLVVVRYFGGIKLGAGGLVRAYTNSGNVVLEKANVVQIVNLDKLEIEGDIAIGAKISNLILSLGGTILETKYSDKVIIHCVGDLENKLKTHFPNIKISKIGSEKVYVRDN